MRQVISLIRAKPPYCYLGCSQASAREMEIYEKVPCGTAMDYIQKKIKSQDRHILMDLFH